MTTAIQPQKKPPPAKALSMRSMPEDLGAEAAVLGSMIIDPSCIGGVIERLDRKAFYHTEHQVIFDAILACYDRNGGTGVDGLLIREELERTNRLDEIGGPEYLQRVLDSTPSSANVQYYCGIVLAKHQCRGVIVLATEALNLAYDSTEEPAQIMSQLEGEIFKLCGSGSHKDLSPTKDLVSRAYELISSKEGNTLTGLSTGFYELDDMLCGLHDGEMITLGARPSIGKTGLAMNIAEHVAIKLEQPTLIFSMEMVNLQLAIRSLCGLAAVDSQRVRKGTVTTEEYSKILEACKVLGEAPLYIDDSTGLTPLLLRSKARRYAHQYGIKLIVIDYLQLMHVDGKVESRTVEITKISQAIKGLARELRVPVIAVSQLNRANENRSDKRPQMSDLRDSGSIEQDSDVILLLHREDYYHKSEPEYIPTNEAEVIVAKQRNGPTGVVKLLFQDKFTRFVNASAITDSDTPF